MPVVSMERMEESCEAEARPDFGRLPMLVMQKIFSKLDIDSKKEARMVCNWWRRILDNPELGRISFRAKITADLVLTLLRTSLQLDQVAISGVTRRMPRRLSAANNRYPRIKKVVIDKGNSAATIKSVLTLGTAHAESLKISNLGLQRMRPSWIGHIVQKIDWNALTQFSIFIAMKNVNFDQHTSSSVSLLKFANFPNLQTFGFDLSRSNWSQEGAGSPLEEVFLAFYLFLATHTNSLTVLNCNITVSDNLWQERLKIPQLSAELKAELMNLKIRECELKTIGRCYNAESVVVPYLLLGSLKKYVRRAYAQNYEGSYLTTRQCHLVKKVCEANGATLEELHIEASRTNLALACITHCLALKKLGLYVPGVGLSGHEEFSGWIAPTLKSLVIPPQLLEFVNVQNRGQIESLTTSEEVGEPSQPSDFQFLKDFVGLKTLEIQRMSLSIVRVLSKAKVSFPALVKFTIGNWAKSYDPEHEMTFCSWVSWVIKAMPNVEILDAGQEERLLKFSQLKKLLKRTKIRELVFLYTGKRIGRYCQDTEGLRIEETFYQCCNQSFGNAVFIGRVVIHRPTFQN